MINAHTILILALMGYAISTIWLETEEVEVSDPIKTRQECKDIGGVTLNTKPYGLCQKDGVIRFKFPNEG